MSSPYDMSKADIVLTIGMKVMMVVGFIMVLTFGADRGVLPVRSAPLAPSAPSANAKK